MLKDLSENQKILSKTQIELCYDGAYWKEEYSPYFQTILLFLTSKCNLKCPKCFNCNNMVSKEDMSFDFIKKLILANPSIDKYDIMGGEPLLHSDICEILYFLDAQNKKIGLYTNGLLLEKVPRDLKNLKINMAFHSIYSDDPSEKPISNVLQELREINKLYPLKVVFLMTQKNKENLFEFVDYVEKNLPNLKKITIGQVRDEQNYYNDNALNVIPLVEYAERMNEFVNQYKGRLNIDLFSEGILFTKFLPQSQPNQINRFRSVFPRGQYIDCLYEVALGLKKEFSVEKPLPFPKLKKCPVTGKNRCITDKIKLQHILCR